MVLLLALHTVWLRFNILQADGDILYILVFNNLLLSKYMGFLYRGVAAWKSANTNPLVVRFYLAALTGIALGLGGSDLHLATIAVCTASRWGGWAPISLHVN